MRSSFRKRLVLLVTILVALSIVSGFYLVSKSQVALSATLNEVNSWKEGNTHKTQYSISLTNPTQSAVNGWRIELSVPEGATIAEGGAWNAKFDIKGQVLTITPLDYNQSISAGGALLTSVLSLVQRKHPKMIFQSFQRYLMMRLLRVLRRRRHHRARIKIRPSPPVKPPALRLRSH